MAKKGPSEEEILRVLREAESGTTVFEICRKRGTSQRSSHRYKRRHAALGLCELRELYQLHEENGDYAPIFRSSAPLSPEGNSVHPFLLFPNISVRKFLTVFVASSKLRSI